MDFQIFGSRKGFTLIEIIVSLIIAGIMGSMLITLGQTALTKSASLVGITQNTYNLETVMEKINADYISMINPENTGTSILDDLESKLSSSPGDYAPSGYTYTASRFRFDSFVSGADDTLVPGGSDSNGSILRVKITDAAGMSLVALFFDNTN